MLVQSALQWNAGEILVDAADSHRACHLAPTPACSSTSRKSTPRQLAFPIKLPPAGLPIHSSVCIRVAAGERLNLVQRQV